MDIYQHINVANELLELSVLSFYRKERKVYGKLTINGYYDGKGFHLSTHEVDSLLESWRLQP